ncbi:MAG: hypothetical protein AB1400_08685 [Pseudomonadota bacterium]
MSHTTGQAADLHRMIVVNESIKEVIRVSAALNMVAINAMLVAKRAGVRSSGFSVVSSELRSFSRKLIEEMHRLGEEIAVLVRDTADLQKLERMHRLLDATLAQHAVNAGYLAAARQRNREVLQAVAQNVEADVRHLLLLLTRSMKLCDTGYTLARSAKVEAVYGGEMSHALRQVADRIEASVTPITPLLKSLCANLKEGVAA